MIEYLFIKYSKSTAEIFKALDQCVHFIYISYFTLFTIKEIYVYIHYKIRDFIAGLSSWKKELEFGLEANNQNGPKSLRGYHWDSFWVRYF